MKNVISIRMTTNLLLLINVLMLLLHILIISKMVPHDFIWGGQIKNDRVLIRLESVAILIQLVFIFLIALKAGYIFPGKLKRTATAGIWIIFVFMIINTIGNLASTSGLETLIMTPLTIVLAMLTLRLALDKENHNNTITL